MVEGIRSLVLSADKLVANLYLSFRQERGAVLCFLFHSLFLDHSQIKQNVVNPLQHTTVADLRQFIEYYLQSGYRFVSVSDLLNGLEPEGKYVLLTFDDGYYSNFLARPLLEEYQVPATFFISTDNVRLNKSFWWDVLYRERMERGASPAEIYREGIALKKLPTHEIEAYLKQHFGEGALQPRGDVDRPFTPAELKEFARSPMVSLGNHTAEHAILTNYPPQQMRQQIAGAQQWLSELTAKPVVSIAYPDGAFNKIVLDLCGELGFKVGFTVEPRKNLLPLEGKSSLLRLNRFATHPKDSIRSQCRMYRSDLLLYQRFRDLYLRLARRRIPE